MKDEERTEHRGSYKYRAPSSARDGNREEKERLSSLRRHRAYRAHKNKPPSHAALILVHARPAHNVIGFTGLGKVSAIYDRDCAFRSSTRERMAYALPIKLACPTPSSHSAALGKQFSLNSSRYVITMESKEPILVKYAREKVNDEITLPLEAAILSVLWRSKIEGKTVTLHRESPRCNYRTRNHVYH